MFRSKRGNEANVPLNPDSRGVFITAGLAASLLVVATGCTSKASEPAAKPAPSVPIEPAAQPGPINFFDEEPRINLPTVDYCASHSESKHHISGTRTAVNVREGINYLDEKTQWGKAGRIAVAEAMVHESGANPCMQEASSQGVLRWSPGGWSRLQTYTYNNGQNPDRLSSQLDFLVKDIQDLGYGKLQHTLETTTSPPRLPLILTKNIFVQTHQRSSRQKP